jgi:YidC/Oxa1 family membrane protein insertase|tara:strand:+ start:461 stop:2176 length:1716 start_codon:yes stop_codon:yes gene_type:complete
MNQDNRNLVLAIVCSALLVIGYQIFFELPKQQALEEQALKEQKELILTAPENSSQSQQEVETSIKDEKIINAPRISIDTPSIEGSISLAGARIDDIVLKNYTKNLDPQSSKIRLFERLDNQKPYFAEFGWIGSGTVDLPNSSSIWTSNSSILEPGKPIILSYKSDNNLKFERIFEINENYLITITDRVMNNGSSEVTLYPYGLVRRTGLPKVDGLFILHEGPIAVIDEKLREVDYDDLVDDGDEIISSEMKGGWIGITDKYWLAALIPDQKDNSEFAFRYSKKSSGQWQSDWRGSSKIISPGSEIETTSHLYAGAKKLALLDEVEEDIGAYRFDLAIDFGWFYFLTKPFFYTLNWLSKYLGNFGLAIIGLTIIIKLLFFPLANGSYRSMAKMRALQPKLTELRERYKGDQQALNKAMMEMYKSEKVNPAAGCLPIFIQIPVFFALYKVLYVTIEMRHAPFYGWINDLSAKDPTSILNLFGILPYSVQNWPIPDFFQLGIWPIVMGITMWLQFRLNPTPPDPVQARIFAWMPVIFTFLLATFPAGLVIYWTINNLLSIGQQWLIMKQTNKPK